MCRIIKQMLLVIGDICRRHNQTLIMEYAKQICTMVGIFVSFIGEWGEGGTNKNRLQDEYLSQIICDKYSSLGTNED